MPTAIREINPPEAQQRHRAGATLIDVREQVEWDAGHIPGAVFIPMGELVGRIGEVVPDKDAELILYCGGGYRAALAADSLQKMGYTNVASMAGGWRAWIEANAPVEED